MNRITSLSNQHVKEVRELLKKPRARKEAGLFVAEGERLCSEIPAPLIHRLFLSDAYRGRLPEGISLDGGDRRAFRLPEELMASVSDTKSSQGILAVVRMLPETLPEGDFFLLLETIQDPGNLGTIFRTAEAAGVSGIYMNRECADIYSPKAVRSTMGALYRMPFFITEDLRETAGRLRAEGVRLYAAHLKGSRTHFEPDYRGPCAFLIGNEANGLSEELSALSEEYLRIPMQGKAESLNAAAAAAVLMYEVLRQRS